MAKSGAQPGNQNASKGKPWTAAIERALAKRGAVAKVQALDALAETLLSNCDTGDMTALKELGDRLEGKPMQATQVSNPDGTPILTGVKVIFVGSNSSVP